MRRSGITAVCEEQKTAWDAGRLPEPEILRSGWWSVPVAIPVGALPGTLAYLHIGRDGVQVIDPGWDSEDTLERFERMLQGIDRRITDIDTVLLTHHHPDHLGAAERLRALSGARVVMSAREAEVIAALAPAAVEDTRRMRRLERWGVPRERRAEMRDAFAGYPAPPSVAPDLRVNDGETIDLGGRPVQVVLTPGHTGGHLCLVDAEAHLLFTGDHVLPRIHSGLGLGIVAGDEPVSQMLDSLDRLHPYDDHEVLPGHEYRFSGLAHRRAGIAAHHLRRAEEVAVRLRVAPDDTIWSIARSLTWTAGWETLSGFYLFSALSQTELHVDALRSGRLDDRLIRV